MRNISKEMSKIMVERVVSMMKCKSSILFVVAAFAALLSPPLASATPILGTAQNFAVLGHTTVTNTGSTVVFGSAATLANVGVYNLGTNADTSTGFSTSGNTFVGPGTNTNGPGLVNAPSAIHLGDSVANQARNDLINAYTALASYGTATNLSGQILGNGGVVPTLTPGVYSFPSTSAQLNGTLQLDAGGVNGVFWVFQIGSTLTTASASAVQLINPGSNLGSDVGVFWVVGSSATLGTTTAFEGNILALTDITLTTGATIYNGRALARNGAVTLDTNIISDICPPASSAPNSGPGFSGGLEFGPNGEVVPVVPTSPVPEPSTMLLLGSGLAGLVAFRKKVKKA